ncbi:MAG TPA: UbiX family flavin prenyltransferase [Symbiobacteriaceae bacterium]|nr:UbiX family flavin prenyltransferase [Symbiobacteriaceae bacterium]
MRIVVGMSGASGAVIGVRLLEALKDHPECESHLVISRSAERTIYDETDYTMDQVLGLADVVHDNRDIGASIASGSFKAAGMVVAPCSMKTLAGIVTGYSENLLLRAADVMIKERRPLILVTREAPLSGIHLENMLKAHQNGCTILPPVPAFYNRPQTVDDVVDHITGRILGYFGLDYKKYRPWCGG